MSGWGRHGLCHHEAYSPVFRDPYHLQKLTNNCGITAVKRKCFQGGGTWDHEIQIMKNFGYWALYLINSTTPTSFARVSKAGKCHLPGLFNDSKKLQENKTSHCLWKERKGTTLLTGVTDCVSSSHGHRLRMGSHGKTQGLVTGEIVKKTMLGTTVPITGSWAFIQVI